MHFQTGAMNQEKKSGIIEIHSRKRWTLHFTIEEVTLQRLALGPRARRETIAR